MQRRLIVDYLVYVIVRILICIVQAIRIETGERLARAMAWLFHDVLRVRGKVVDENLAYAFTEMTPAERARLARQMWEHLFLLVLEVAHAPRKIHQTNWREFVGLKNQEELVRALLDDRPTLIVTAHLGNFEVGGYVLGILGFPTYTIARTLDNPFLDRFVNRFRGGTGQRIIPKNGGYDQIVEVLSRGGTMTFLADQYAGSKGCWVEFFGRPASAHKAIALLALEHNARVSVCASRRRGRPMRFELDNHAMIDPREDAGSLNTIPELTQWYTSRLEELIRHAPVQYWWLHRRWKDTRRRRAKKKAA
ncbi:MAG: lysophospholipid acyltransferase family protein [Planctomycetes bacterium]|nr:lysophospholipid acyltransferase family protein [Planctomycetota bacterium]MBU4398574.1 lysophospholipid acyltransferase family protein [Planctomycetota bacterium]MCG2683350.1 lysophospholipid acyltransferase family protein [Planctomycetales bacterium]